MSERPERQISGAQLHVLDDMAFILECMALTYTGEGKSELGALIQRIEQHPEIAHFVGDQLHPLKNAKTLLIRGDYPEAASALARVSRILWNRVRPSGS